MLRRVPLRRRSPMRRTYRRDNVVKPDDRAYVMRRDGECVLHKRDPFHVCRDQWGAWHTADNIQRLTLEHVKPELGMSIKADSIPSQMVALCGERNVTRPMTKDERAWVRLYLRLQEGTNA